MYWLVVMWCYAQRNVIFVFPFFRYHLKGDQEGHLEVFADNLPGFPDNIRRSSRGGYWVGMGSARKAPFSMFDVLAPRPWIRKFIAKVCISLHNPVTINFMKRSNLPNDVFCYRSLIVCANNNLIYAAQL